MGMFNILKRYLQRTFRASISMMVSLASGETLAETPLFASSEEIVIDKILFVPPAAFTLDAANYKSIVIKNKGIAGAGTDEICNVDLGDDENLVAFDQVDLGTLANNRIAAGGVVSIEVTETGSGTRPVFTNMALVIEYTRGVE